MSQHDNVEEPAQPQSTIQFQPQGIALDHGQSDEDLARADVYGLLAELLGRPPSDLLFNRLAASPSLGAEEPDTPLTRAWRELVAAACRLDPVAIRAEFSRLFEGVGKPEVVPNGSFYLVGALNQRPLIELRQTLLSLSIERDPESSETEDHIAAVCEVMRFLVAGEQETESPSPPIDTLTRQASFFQAHLASWVFDFFQAVESHREADFYLAVAGFGRAFLEVEQQAFDIYSAGLSSEA